MRPSGSPACMGFRGAGLLARHAALAGSQEIHEMRDFRHIRDLLLDAPARLVEREPGAKGDAVRALEELDLLAREAAAPEADGVEPEQPRAIALGEAVGRDVERDHGARAEERALADAHELS